jgi:hypothetical protein
VVQRIFSKSDPEIRLWETCAPLERPSSISIPTPAVLDFTWRLYETGPLSKIAAPMTAQDEPPGAVSFAMLRWRYSRWMRLGDICSFAAWPFFA